MCPKVLVTDAIKMGANRIMFREHDETKLYDKTRFIGTYSSVFTEMFKFCLPIIMLCLFTEVDYKNKISWHSCIQVRRSDFAAQ